MPIYDVNLWQFFKKKSEESKTISMSDRFKLFWFIFDGLEEIHRNKMKHLDIKLSNLMIKVDAAGDFDGSSPENCVITDFGIGGKKHKKTGLAGTPGFASPEQLVSDKVGAESDIYSLGRLMVFVFAEWNSAWAILYQPVENISIVHLTPKNLRTVMLLDVIRGLLKVCSSRKITVSELITQINV